MVKVLKDTRKTSQILVKGRFVSGRNTSVKYVGPKARRG